MQRLVETSYVKNTKKKYSQENHARQQLNQNNGSNNTPVSKSSSEFHQNAFRVLVPQKIPSLKALTYVTSKMHSCKNQMFEDQMAHSEVCIKNTWRIHLGKTATAVTQSQAKLRKNPPI